VEKGLAKDPELAEGIAAEKADNLVKRLQEPDFRARRVFELTRNPLLLTNICLVHRHRGSLPRKRARLYEECIDVLLEHWREAKGLKVGVTARDGCRALQPVAFWLHSEEGRTQATAEELKPHIEPVLKAVDWKDGTTEDFLHTIRDDSGLLTGWDQEHYGFMHLGFQEYLAAREIRSLSFEDPAVLQELALRFGESWWQEVGLLLLALEDPSRFIPYMREVVKQPAFGDASHSNLVEACLDDAAEKSPRPFLELLQIDPGNDTGLWKRQFVALRVLERLDPNAVNGLKSILERHPYPEIRKWIKGQAEQALLDVITAEQGGYELIKIPGGVFMMGSPESEQGRYDYERPLHKVTVPDFYIGRYPVTNEEYGLFLKENPALREPEYWADRQFNQPRQPVVGVSWDDAKKYAKWAGLRLPTEAEWEYACRANTQTRYYTADKEEDLDRAGWYDKNSGGRLHTVGEKEPNSFGLYDMHGNVWEWVEDDWHGNYNGGPNDGRAWSDSPRGSLRVFRGGSWGNDAIYCRSAIRSFYLPDDRYGLLGFRLSRSVSLGP
jgi:formylglycine-generating enzyme required for sulfatase activity